MRDQDCVAFLQWCLPRLGLRWAGYRKVRRTVCKRVTRRMRALGLVSTDAYRAYLAEHPDEWQQLDAYCRIPISRFYRDREVFRLLAEDVLPELARAAARRCDRVIRCWCAGCASGEEPHTLAIVWHLSVQRDFPGVTIDILGTDADAVVLRRAERACYAPGSLKELPAAYRERAFVEREGLFCLRPELRRVTRFRRQDIRTAQPDGPFDLVLCRNLVFTYFEPAQQRETLARIGAHLADGGFLVIGSHEQLPAGEDSYVKASDTRPIYRRRGAGRACGLGPRTARVDRA